MIDTTDILHARILIVDDQEANVLLLERMLQEAGYTQVSSTRQPAQVARLQHPGQRAAGAHQRGQFAVGNEHGRWQHSAGRLV